MRRKRGSPVTLFSFLDILAAAVGTLVLIIAAMLALSLPEVEQGIEAGAPGNQRQPVFVECTRAGLLLHPDGVDVPQAVIKTSETWSSLLRELVESAEQRYLILLVRPGGLDSFRVAESMANALELEVGYDPIYDAGPVVIKEGGQDS